MVKIIWEGFGRQEVEEEKVKVFLYTPRRQL
jgi:hypothetical protein